MSPQLLERLFSNIKRIIAQPIALADRKGVIYQEYSDLTDQKHFTINDPIRPDQHSLEVLEDKSLRAIPVFSSNRFYVLVILKLQAEDLQLVQIISSLAELIIQQFVAEFRPKPDAVDLLLTRIAYKSNTIDGEEFSQQMAALGYRLDIQRAAIAIELKGFWNNYLQTAGTPLGEKEDLIAAKKRDIEQSLNSFFSKNQDNLIGYIGGDTFLILKDLQDSDYEKFCQLLSDQFKRITGPLTNIHIKEVTIGIGQKANSPLSLMQSVSQALQILRIGRRMAGSDLVHRFSSLGVLPLIISANDQQKLDHAQEVFAQVDDPELLETLDAFLLSNLNLTQTAERLKIHRNTVIYRLDRLAEKLGKDPRRFEDAVELYLSGLFIKVLA